MSDPCPRVWITAEGGVVLDEMAELGREVVLNGQLADLRKHLGLSHSADRRRTEARGAEPPAFMRHHSKSPAYRVSRMT